MNSCFLSAGVLGLGTAFITLWLILRFGRAAVLLRRSTDWHHTSRARVPRLGGAALVLAFLAVELYSQIVDETSTPGAPLRELIVCASLAMFGLGFWDDIRPLGAIEKLVGQTLIGAGAWFCGIRLEVLSLPFAGIVLPLGVAGPVLTILFLVVLTNVINLTDGLDGLAGGICLMLMILLSVIGYPNGVMAFLAPGMVGALVGFLCFNLPPARLYLGDGGAYFLGFQVASYCICGSRQGADFGSLTAPLFLLAFPLTDAVVTILRRGLRGLPLFRPDRHHLHHRISGAGVSASKVVLSLYALNLAFLLIGLLAYFSGGRWVPILSVATLLILLICAVLCKPTRRWLAMHRIVSSSLRMRKEIQHALRLVRWMNLESRKCSSFNELWRNLVFAADKLGFAALTLTRHDQQRCWQRGPSLAKGARRRFGFPQGDYGRLEFIAPACLFEGSGRTRPCDADLRCRARPNGCLASSRLFETISELLAESWSKASVGSNGTGHSPVSNGSMQCAESSRSAQVAKSFSLVGLALLLEGSSFTAVGQDNTQYYQSLARVPAPELPATSANLAGQAAPEARGACAGRIARTAVKINPAATVAVVGAISRAQPATAGEVAETAVREQPSLAPDICRAAVAAAPQHTLEIVTRMAHVVPADLMRVAIAASEAAPAASVDILRAVASLRPGLKPYLDRELARCAPAIPSVSRCLGRAQASQLRDATEMALADSRTNGNNTLGSPVPAASIPLKPIGPKPPHGGVDHPPGGRNYARP